MWIYPQLCETFSGWRAVACVLAAYPLFRQCCHFGNLIRRTLIAAACVRSVTCAAASSWCCLMVLAASLRMVGTGCMPWHGCLRGNRSDQRGVLALASSAHTFAPYSCLHFCSRSWLGMCSDLRHACVLAMHCSSILLSMQQVCVSFTS
jgi:hypothetical protein